MEQVSQKTMLNSIRRKLVESHALLWAASFLTVTVIVLQNYFRAEAILFVKIIGVVILLSTIPLIFLPMFSLLRYGQIEEGKNYMHTSITVDRGLFAVVRHPQYLGYIFLNIGFMLISRHLLIVFLGASAIALIYAEALHEERTLMSEFPEEYCHYVQQVPRFNILVGIFRWWRHKET